MHWFQTLDTGLFRFINETLSNPVFDVIMPFLSGNRLFVPLLLVAAGVMLWKGGVRGRLCVFMLLVIVWPGDSFFYKTVKHAVARPRPYLEVSDARLFGSRVEPQLRDMSQAGGVLIGPDARPSGHDSMPSSHAGNWFAATMILLVYYRRSAWLMLPLACLVSLSRVYNGVHYPSDVLAGAILGAGFAAGAMVLVNGAWRWAGRRWFPLWWRHRPSLLNPEESAEAGGTQLMSAGPRPKTGAMIAPQHSTDSHWLRLGYVFIGLLLLTNLVYIGSGIIELSEDEAYQWVWSKHPALSYYSKPPMIAYTQMLGTTLWGDNEFGVRFFSPVISAVLGLLLLRFFAKEVNARAGFFLLLILAATPMLAVGSVLMTIDPLSVLFWTAAMLAGWRAVQPGSSVKWWLWTGLWMGFGFLSKYTQLFQLLCWVVFFVLWKPARAQLRRPGPYLALLINCLCAVPVLVWNYQHDWITVTHVSENAAVGRPWEFTLRHVFEFLLSEAVLLNPVFFLGALWAAAAFWRRSRQDPRLVYLFSMGAPLFLSYLLHSVRAGVLPNWIVPSVLPLFCLMTIYWDTRWRLGQGAPKRWLIAGLCIGVPIVVLLHDTDLIGKVVGQPLPAKKDPMTRLRGYRHMAEIVNTARVDLLQAGKPVFIIGAHYGTTGLLSFYLPEARTNIIEQPLVYFLNTPWAVNQFYFWPGYQDQRKGQNAIYVHELAQPPLIDGWRWFPKWLAGEEKLGTEPFQPVLPPPGLLMEFEAVRSLGLYHALYDGRIFHTVQLFECRNLR